MSWCAIRTKVNQERHVESQLRRCGIETLLPFVKETRVIRRCRKTVISPLFPGYIFGRLDLSKHYRLAAYARGARAIVAFGGEPARIDQSVIDSIRARLTEGVLTIQSQTFTVGQTVRIHSGPFSGLEAVFQYEMTGRQRAVVLLQCLAYQGRIVVPMEQVANG